jgi:hypothetical protein
MSYAGDTQIYLFGCGCGALVDQAEEIPERPARGALWDHPEPDFVADQDHGLVKRVCARDEPLELLHRPALFSTVHPSRHPEGEGIKQHRVPLLRRFEDRVQASTREFQQAPARVAPLTVGFDAPQEIRVIRTCEGGRDVEHAFAADAERTLFSEGALAAPGAAEDQSVDPYGTSLRSTSRSVCTSRSFSFALRTATRKKPGPSP